MHGHKYPTPYDLLDRLNQEYIDFLIDVYPEAFEDSNDTTDPGNPVYERSLKPDFDLNYNDMAKRLGYVDLNGFVAYQLAEDGISQEDWSNTFRADRLGTL